MAWIRQLHRAGCPGKDQCKGCGLWAATVRGPTGRKVITDPLKSVVTAMAADLESDARRGDYIDPHAGKVLIGDWYERCRGSRHLERASRLRDESQWLNHVAPRWAKVPVGNPMKPDVGRWVVEMQEAGVGAWTIVGALKVLRGLMDQAVESKLRRDNPARGVKVAPPEAHVDRVLDIEEERQILARLDELFPGRVDARLFVELLLDTGLRWEEAAVIPPELVDTRRQRIQIAWVMERDGTARPYAKSEAGNRAVTYGDQLAERIKAAKADAQVCPDVFPESDGRRRYPTQLVFYSPGGGGTGKRKKGEAGPLRYSNWHRQVWARGLTVVVQMPAKPKPAGRPGPAARPVKRVHYLDDPQPTPHDCRHTFGSRLADNGVQPHDIMALMGHKDLRSVQRYLHSREERFDRARRALKRARGESSDPDS